jgi:hypothetical protein
MPITWQGIEARNNHLPSQVYAGDTPIIVKRPSAESTLTVYGEGISDQIIVTPMPKPLSPELLYLNQCSVMQTPQPLPQLPAGASTSWTCPVLQKGSYDVAISMTPSAAGGPFRVLYSLDVNVGQGANFHSTHIYSGNMDINADVGLPNVFQGSGSVLVNDGDIALVILNISHVVDHCCFPSSGGHDGTINIPAGVSIVLKRAG